MSNLDRVREALRASLSVWATVEVLEEQARVVLSPDPELLAQQLSQAGLEWSLGWRCDHVAPAHYVVGVRLEVGGVYREGLAQGQTLQDARWLALADLAGLFGLSTGEGYLVEYDPEDGPNTAELLPELPEAVAPAASLPEPPRDPQMEKARQHIDELVEKLKEAGRGAEAMRFMLKGYGATVEESRGIYRQLKAVLDNASDGEDA